MSTQTESHLAIVSSSAPPSAAASLEPPLPTPRDLSQEFPLTAAAQQQVRHVRSRVRARIEHGIGPQLAIVGPCSIHCEAAAVEYAERLARLQRALGERVQIIMRVYVEKPRTTVGWKGFLYDPDVSGHEDLALGLCRTRRLMVKIAQLGVPIATEIVDPMATSYFEDCLSWVAIGARTSESQVHRQLASGLRCAVGFKNGTDGSVEVAVQASEAAARGHCSLAIDEEGRIAMSRSYGNSATHVVLRGGRAGPNYDLVSMARAAAALRAAGRRPSVLVDCSHGNSEKDHDRQPEVARAVLAQRRDAAADVVGLMIESHLQAGKQSASAPLRYGVSITDGCIDFATTEALLRQMAEDWF